MDVIKPVEGNPSKKLRSKDIIKGFLDSNLDVGEVDVESTGRPISNVYTSLLTYVQRHQELNVEVRLVDGCIFLFRNLK